MASWRDRAVIVAAVAASIATSKARWRIAVDLPVVKPSTGAHQLVVEASTVPHIVLCSLPAGDRVIEPQIHDTTYSYLCPPEGQFVGPLWITGEGTGCEQPRPPPDAFLRVVKLDEAWAITTTAVIPFPPDPASNNSGRARFKVHAPGEVIVRFDAGQVGSPKFLHTDDPTRYDVSIPYVDPASPPRDLTVQATAYGIGPEPAATSIAIEALP